MLQEKLYSRKIVVCDTENTYVYFQVFLTGNQFNVITIYVVFNFSSSESIGSLWYLCCRIVSIHWTCMNFLRIFNQRLDFLR